jgi:hypothetical protein
LWLLAQAAGAQTKTTAVCAGGGLRKSAVLSLSDPRRRVRYDAYDDYTDDDGQHCVGSVGAEVTGSGHAGFGFGKIGWAQTIADPKNKIKWAGDWNSR